MRMSKDARIKPQPNHDNMYLKPPHLDLSYRQKENKNHFQFLSP